MKTEHRRVQESRAWIICVVGLLLAIGCGRSSDGDSSAKDKDKAAEPGAATAIQPDPAKAQPTPVKPEAKAPAVEVPADYPGVAITASEVRFAGKPIGAPAAVVGDRALLVAPIKQALEAAGDPSAQSVSLGVLVAPTAPGDALMAAVRAGFEAGISEVIIMDRVIHDAKDAVCAVVAGAPAAPEAVKISVIVEAAQIWVGLSRINDFRKIEPIDGAALAEVIEEHGTSSYFADRKDAEIAVASGVSARTLLPVLAPLCKRFPALRPLSRDELSAKPML